MLMPIYAEMIKTARILHSPNIAEWMEAVAADPRPRADRAADRREPQPRRARVDARGGEVAD